MNNAPPTTPVCREPSSLCAEENTFRLFFERSTDPIWLLDPQTGTFVDCNDAAVTLLRAGSRERLLGTQPKDLSPEIQPDGTPTAEMQAWVIDQVERLGGLKFEWLARRFDGSLMPTEVAATRLVVGGRVLHAVVTRDISERKKQEQDLRESEARFRALFERSADAMSLFDPQLGRFIDSNDAVARQTGAPNREALGNASPAEISPERQPDGSLSSEKVAEMVRLALVNGSHRFEWLSRRFDGRELPLDVVLTTLPFGDRQLLLTVSRDIAEQKQAEEEVRRLNAILEQRVAERTAELAASEARLRTLVEHAPEAMVVFDGETGRFLNCSENAPGLFGLSREQLLTLHPADISPLVQSDGRSSRDAAREYIRRAVEGQKPVFEWTHQHVDGRLIPCEVRLVRLPAEGQVLVRGSIIDNTERRRREKIQQATYRISEAVHAAGDLNSLYRRIHEIISSLMPARNFYIALLDAAAEMISFPYFVDEHGGHPEPFKLNIGLTGYVLRSGRSLLLDAAMNARKKHVGDAVTFEGHEEIRYIETGRPAAIWLGVPLSIGGHPFGAMAVQDYHDERAYGEAEKQVFEFIATQIALAIERKRSEQALRENEQKFRALFEATSQGVMIHDEEKFLEVNPALLRVMGFKSAAEIIGKHPSDTAPPFQPGGESSATLAAKHIAECMTHGSARFDWVCRNGRGEEAPFEVMLTRIEMGGRQLIQAVVNDISERKRVEAELLRALAREKELSQLKSNFVSLVSHEFRTPLGVISSSAEILRDYLVDLPEGERRDHLDTIVRNTRRMSDLMEEVLVLGRLDAGRMAFEPSALDLAVLCRRLVDEVQSATNHACSIALTMDSLLTEAHADEKLLRHILTNLLVNAVKYSEPGSPVEFRASREGDDMAFVIRDRGIGITPADQTRLFNSFQRGANVGQRPGSGLGLLIVKRCVDLHRGTIRLESAVNEGTTVTVQLPLFRKLDEVRD